jgi:hypothetical protein
MNSLLLSLLSLRLVHCLDCSVFLCQFLSSGATSPQPRTLSVYVDAQLLATTTYSASQLALSSPAHRFLGTCVTSRLVLAGVAHIIHVCACVRMFGGMQVIARLHLLVRLAAHHLHSCRQLVTRFFA